MAELALNDFDFSASIKKYARPVRNAQKNSAGMTDVSSATGRKTLDKFGRAPQITISDFSSTLVM
jgi:hypothetical protein